MKVYEVVGWRKEYYLRCKREVWERQERLRDFLQKELGIDREDVIRYNTSVPEAVIKNPEKYENLKERKDVRFKPQGYDFLKGKYLEAEIVPYRRTKEGKELYERWKDTLLGDFGILLLNTPFFLKLSWMNISNEDAKYVDHSQGVTAVVREEGDRLFLVNWKGFNPEKLEGFKPVEVPLGVG